MVGVSASVNLPLHHKVQKFCSGTGSPRWSRKKSRGVVEVVVIYCSNTAEARRCPKYLERLAVEADGLLGEALFTLDVGEVVE